jgi:hypothetical protein
MLWLSEGFASSFAPPSTDEPPINTSSAHGRRMAPRFPRIIGGSEVNPAFSRSFVVSLLRDYSGSGAVYGSAVREQRPHSHIDTRRQRAPTHSH